MHEPDRRPRLFCPNLSSSYRRSARLVPFFHKGPPPLIFRFRRSNWYENFPPNETKISGKIRQLVIRNIKGVIGRYMPIRGVAGFSLSGKKYSLTSFLSPNGSFGYFFNTRADPPLPPVLPKTCTIGIPNEITNRSPPILRYVVHVLGSLHVLELQKKVHFLELQNMYHRHS